MRLRVSQLPARLASISLARELHHPGLVVVGNAAYAFGTFFALIVSARAVGTAEYAWLVTYIVLSEVVSTLVDSGTSTALTRYVSATSGRLAKGSDPAATTLHLQLRIAVGLLLAAWLLRGTSSLLFQGSAQSDLLYWLSIIVAILRAAWRYVESITIAHERFAMLSKGRIAAGVVTLAGCLATLFASSITSQRPSAFALAIPFGAGAAAGLIALARSAMKEISLWQELRIADLKHLLRFSVWVMLSNVLVTAVMRAGVLLLALLSNAIETGKFSFAYSVGLGVVVIVNSINTTLMAAASRVQNSHDFTTYVRKALRLSAAGTALVVPAILFAEPLVQLFGGEAFVPAISLVRLMMVTFLINVVGNPIGLIAFTFERPSIVASANALQLAIVVLVGYLLIPMVGALGASLAFLIATIVGVTVVDLWALHHARAAGWLR